MSRDRSSAACRWQITNLHFSCVVSFVQAVSQADLAIHSETPAVTQGHAPGWTMVARRYEIGSNALLTAVHDVKEASVNVAVELLR